MFLFVSWIIDFDVPQIFHTIKSVPRLQKTLRTTDLIYTSQTFFEGSFRAGMSNLFLQRTSYKFKDVRV